MDTSLSRIASQQGDIHMLILGGGKGGAELLELFYHYRDWLFIDGIVDIDAQAIAIQKAKSLKIPTYLDAQDAIKQFKGDIIIDVTGNPELAKILHHANTQHADLEIISGKSSRLLFDLVTQGHKNRQTIKNKDLHLNLLNAMLDLSLKLETHQTTSDVVKHAITGLHTGLQANKALAIIIEENSNECFSILGSQISSPLPDYFIQELKEYFLSPEHTNKSFVSLQPALVVPFIDDTFNLAIPLIHHQRLIALLLIEHSKPLGSDIEMILKVASSHLHLAIQTKEYNKELEYQAIRDPLTGIYNRRYFTSRLDEEFNRLQREQQNSLSCMFFDVDLFKLINDKYGHDVGDILLIKVAEQIQLHLRAYDVVARYGGDEFIALLPGDVGKTVPLEQIANRILDSVKNIHINGHKELKINLSIGVSCIHSSSVKTSKELISLADQALYCAKDDGRGCVRLGKTV